MERLGYYRGMHASFLSAIGAFRVWKTTQLPNSFKKTGVEWDLEHLKSRLNLLRNHCPADNNFVSWTDVHKNFEKANVASHGQIWLSSDLHCWADSDPCGGNLRWRPQLSFYQRCTEKCFDWAVSLHTEWIITNQKTFKSALSQVETASKSLAINVSALAKDIAAVVSVFRYAAKIMKQQGRKLVKSLVFMPPSPQPSSSNSSINDFWKSLTGGSSKRKPPRHKLFVFHRMKAGDF